MVVFKGSGTIEQTELEDVIIDKGNMKFKSVKFKGTCIIRGKARFIQCTLGKVTLESGFMSVIESNVKEVIIMSGNAKVKGSSTVTTLECKSKDGCSVYIDETSKITTNKGAKVEPLLGYKDKEAAEKSVKAVKKLPRDVQVTKVAQLYNLAKNHHNQTPGMKEAMAVFKKFIV